MEMDPSQIKTIGDFRRFVLLLADAIAPTTPKSLEEYLRALWNLIQQAQAKPVTYALFGQLLQDAFLADPLPVHEMWLQYEAPPDLHEDENGKSFAVLQQMICYQIADLHRMAQAGLLENQWRYFGIDSPTGHRWYNFDPSSYLECAPQSIREDRTSSRLGLVVPKFSRLTATDASWLDLAILLWLGQSYE